MRGVLCPGNLSNGFLRVSDVASLRDCACGCQREVIVKKGNE
jgi:hypothetical protein